MVNERSTTSVSDMTPLPLEALRERGVLWAINKYLFHPQGFALALCLDDDGKVDGWNLLGDGTEAWAFESDEPEATAFEEFRRSLLG